MQLAAHKAILCIHSDYFRAMFTSGLQESSVSDPTVNLDQVSASVVHSVIQYMYTGNIQGECTCGIMNTGN